MDWCCSLKGFFQLQRLLVSMWCFSKINWSIYFKSRSPAEKKKANWFGLLEAPPDIRSFWHADGSDDQIVFLGTSSSSSSRYSFAVPGRHPGTSPPGTHVLLSLSWGRHFFYINIGASYAAGTTRVLPTVISFSIGHRLPCSTKPKIDLKVLLIWQGNSISDIGRATVMRLGITCRLSLPTVVNGTLLLPKVSCIERRLIHTCGNEGYPYSRCKGPPRQPLTRRIVFSSELELHIHGAHEFIIVFSNLT